VVSDNTISLLFSIINSLITALYQLYASDTWLEIFTIYWFYLIKEYKLQPNTCTICLIKEVPTRTVKTLNHLNANEWSSTKSIY